MMVSQLETNNVEKLQTKCGKAIEYFIKSKKPNTARAYKGDIKRFLKVMFDKTLDTITIEELGTFEFEYFIQYLDTFDEVKNTTINRHISTVKELYKHLKKINMLKDISYIDLVDAKDNDGVEIEPMPIDVVESYINEAGREVHNAEEKQKIILLASDQGLRMDELLSLSWRSFTPKEDGVIINGYGKGNKKFTKKIKQWVYEELLELRKGADLDSKVFSSLTPKNITDMMIRLRIVLGYEERRYSFHSFRKSAVTYEHKHNGGDLIKTQRFAGHSNPNTTQIYIGADETAVSGMFSTRNDDPHAYKKISHEKLLEVLEELNNDTLHLINAKILQRNK